MDELEELIVLLMEKVDFQRNRVTNLAKTMNYQHAADTEKFIAGLQSAVVEAQRLLCEKQNKRRRA